MRSFLENLLLVLGWLLVAWGLYLWSTSLALIWLGALCVFFAVASYAGREKDEHSSEP